MGKIGLGVKGLITIDGKILVLIKSNGEWDLAGGRVEDDEKYEDCLYREIFEETGLEVGIKEFIAGWSFKKNSNLFVIGRTYLCEYLSGRLILSDEHVDYFWFDPEKHNDFTSELGRKYKFQSFLYKRSFF